jgi:hypothetical protein
MWFTQHHSNNRVLGAPAGWKQAELPCHALPVTVTEEDGRTVQCSYWRPTAAERLAIAGGALVQLWIHSAAHPPVSLTVEGIHDADQA